MEYALSKKFSSGIAVFLIKLRTRHERTCSCKVFHRGWPKIEAPKNQRAFFMILLIGTVQNTVIWDL